MTTPRTPKSQSISQIDYVLTSGQTAYSGHMACLDTSTGKVTPGQASTTLVPIGTFYGVLGGDSGLLGDGTKTVNVKFPNGIECLWFDNDSGSPVLAANLGSECYIKDSHTVTMNSTGNSKAGRVIKLDTLKGVCVQLGFAVTGPTGAAGASDASVADRTALAAISAANRADGTQMLVRSDGSRWRFIATPAATYSASDEAQELVILPASGTGAWVRMDKSFTLALPCSFATADAAALLTIPEGFVVCMTGDPYWENTTAWSGGTNSAIGVSSNKTGFSTKGDLQGGASGDLTAAMGAGIKKGTAGAKLDTVAHRALATFVEGDTIRFDRIASVYTAGAGFWHLPVSVQMNGPLTP